MATFRNTDNNAVLDAKSFSGAIVSLAAMLNSIHERLARVESAVVRDAPGKTFFTPEKREANGSGQVLFVLTGHNTLASAEHVNQTRSKCV